MAKITINDFLGNLQSRRKAIFGIPIALGATLIVVAVLLSALGANPFHALMGMVEGSVGGSRSIEQTLLVMAPLLLASIAISIPFSARVFNIGANGQMSVGAAAATSVIFLFPNVNGAVLTVFAVVAAAIGGLVFGGIAGILKAYFNANEVIVTLMMNFVGLLIVSAIVAGPWNNPMGEQTNPFPSAVGIPDIGGFNAGIWIAIICAIIAHIVLFRSRLGFAIRAMGFNPHASRRAGFSRKAITIATLSAGGAIAGLAGAVVVLGQYGLLLKDVTSDYGFTGIAVSLVAALRPIALIPVSFLFGAIIVGSHTLPATTGISGATSELVLGLMVLLILGFRIIRLPVPEAQ